MDRKWRILGVVGGEGGIRTRTRAADRGQPRGEAPTSPVQQL